MARFGLFIILAFASAGALLAQGFDPAKTPVTTVPASRWGTLEPRGILGDSSWWNFGSTPSPSHPFYHDVDTENGWVFASTGRGLMIWDARTNPATPPRTAYRFAGPVGAGQVVPPQASLFPDWHQNDTKFYLFGLDAPEGVDSVLGMGCISDNGFVVWDTSNKTMPDVRYQDDAKDGTQVWATTYGGKHFAFFGATSKKVLVYDMSAAVEIPSSQWFPGTKACLDNSPSSTPCQNSAGEKVYLRQIPTRSGANYLHGVGDYLAVSHGSLGVDIWRVAAPGATPRTHTPTSVVQIPSSVAGFASGVALWRQGSNHYLATIDGVTPEVRILDVSCITSACASTPPIISRFHLGSTIYSLKFLTFSRRGNTPFLYVGGENQFTYVPQREFLLDVSNPVVPEDVTPFHAQGYWGWYYFDLNSGGGFNWVMPRTGKFNGDHFVRAGFSVLDIHESVGSTPPVADFSWSPSEVYPGTPVGFTDLSTGNPTAWTWTFQDGTPSFSGLKNPAGVTFGSVGGKNVGLIAENMAGPSPQRNKTVTVLNPVPVIGGVTVSPSVDGVQCQPLTFAGTGVTGKPPLTYAWAIKNSSSTTVASGSGTTLVWDTSQPPLPATGAYTAELTVSNNDPPAAFRSQGFTLQAPEPLPLAGFGPPTIDPFAAGTVQFHIVATGDTAWNWDFDGDGVFNESDWVSDPINGPNPVHTYTSTGIRLVRVKIRNCLEPAGVESLPVTVNIQQLVQLKAEFAAFCLFGCFFDVGQSIAFTDASTGADFWDYDWDGNGTWDQVGQTAAVTAHTYALPGSYRPRLRVRRSSGESAEFTHVATVIVSNVQQQQPAIVVSGPTSGQVGATLNFSAAASNCTPSSSGWNWTTTSGTISGSSTGSSISVSWSTAGAKTVRATNSNCGTAAGNRGVTITSTGGGGGGLAAQFTYLPAAPAPGVPINFDSATSTGTITTRVWDFGDGTSGDGVQVAHTYASAGTYNVKLTLTGPGSCPPAPFCEATKTQAVVVINSNPALVPSFTSPVCISELSFTVCRANTGQEVQLTDTSSGPVASRSWTFGDGGTATGSPVGHAWQTPGNFTVTLTISDGTNTAQKSQLFVIEGEPVPTIQTLVIPWISQTTAPLLQTSDLFLYNPGPPAEFTLTFRKRGTPETPPPTWTATLGAGETIYVSDVMDEKFDRVNVSGSLQIEGDRLPVAISFNQTFGEDGQSYGQAVPAVPPDQLSEEAGGAPQHVIGLNDNDERVAYFGVSNPTDEGASFRARIYRRDPDTGGAPQLIALTPSVQVAAHGMKQYPVSDLRGFGVIDQSDYRVEVETLTGGPLIPFGANVRIATEDPAFTLEGGTDAAQQVFLGALRKPGLANSLWVTQLVLFNPTTQSMPVSLRFVHAGLTAGSEDAVPLTLAPGETRRLLDPLFALWGLTDSAGVVVVQSAGVGGVHPVAQVETFDDQVGDDGLPRRYGQYVTPRNAAHVATGSRQQVLVGLRQDEQFRTVLWLYSPSGGHVDLVYRSLGGAVLGTIANFPLGPGGARQVAPSQHALPAEFAGRFTLEVKLRDGDVLSAAQVVNNANNDPAYITGETR